MLESEFEDIKLIKGSNALSLEEVKGRIAQLREKGKQTQPNEIETQAEDRRIIELGVKGINQVLKELDIDIQFSFDLDRFHNIPADISRLFDIGGYNSRTHMVELIHRAQSPLTLPHKINVIIHELVHSLSVSGFQYSEINNEVMPYRSGYRIEGNKLKGLNEAVTEKIKDAAIDAIASDLVATFPVTTDEIYQAANDYYNTEVLILDNILRGISTTQNVDRHLVWKKIVKGYVYGDMMQLRDIDKTFGRGSLALVSLLGEEHDPLGTFEEAVLDYFEAETKEDRKRAIESAFPLYEHEIEFAENEEERKEYEEMKKENIQRRLKLLAAISK